MRLALTSKKFCPNQMWKSCKQLYLNLAQAEQDLHSILDCEGLIDNPDGIKDAFDSITDQDDKEALYDYYEHSFDERNGNLNNLNLRKSVSGWAARICGSGRLKILH